MRLIRMNSLLQMLVASYCILLHANLAQAQWISQQPRSNYPDGNTILEQVRQTFPNSPVQLTADLVAKNKRGKITHEYRLEARMDFQTDDVCAQYILSDAFGDELSTVTITRQPDGATHFTHAGTQPDTVPDSVHLSDTIDGLDFSWSDLSFSFLWWTNAALLDVDQKLNRDCYIVEVIPSPSDETDYPFMKLWIDTKTSGLLQAEAYDSKGELRKKLQVKSLRKINGLRTIGDVETYSYPERTKTRLRIRDFVVDQDQDTESHE